MMHIGTNAKEGNCIPCQCTCACTSHITLDLYNGICSYCEHGLCVDENGCDI